MSLRAIRRRRRRGNLYDGINKMIEILTVTEFTPMKIGASSE